MVELDGVGPVGDEGLTEQIDRIVDDLLCRRAAGEEVSDRALIEAYPHLMPQLGIELRRLRLIEAARYKREQPPPPKGSDESTLPIAELRSAPGRSGAQVVSEARGLRVRCPHCHNPVEIAESLPLTEIRCGACGSTFSLVDKEISTRQAAAIKRLGRFDLIEILGSGSFGTVWKARDTELDRTVAVKIPRRGHVDSTEQELFLREARAAAQLHHPNIVNVHEVGRDEDTVYIVSDILRGVKLSEWLQARRPTLREAVGLCLKIADALHHAHQAGIVHRDLKPSNIIIDAQGEPHVTDFGLAKRDVGEVTITVEGRILGTPAYMSPEQARGEGHHADGRSDVYSLGVILYQLLTGELPFRGSERMLILQVLTDEAPSPRKFDGCVPRDLETVCLKCLEKDPGRRYATAKELVEELKRFLDGQPVKARPVGALGRLWRWYRRNASAPVWIAGGFVVISSAVLLLWGSVGLVVLALLRQSLANPGKAMLDLVMLMAGLYLPMLWVGIRTLKGGVCALWAGVILFSLGFLLAVSGLLGFAFEPEVYGNLPQRAALFSLLAVLAFLGTVLHAAAIVSRDARRDRSDRGSRA